MRHRRLKGWSTPETKYVVTESDKIACDKYSAHQITQFQILRNKHCFVI